MKQEKVITQIHKFVKDQGGDTNRFFNSQKATITDLYRMDQSLEMRKINIERIESLLEERKFFLEGSPEHTNTINELSREIYNLKSLTKESQKIMKLLKINTKTQEKLSDKMENKKNKIKRFLNFL